MSDNVTRWYETVDGLPVQAEWTDGGQVLLTFGHSPTCPALNDGRAIPFTEETVEGMFDRGELRRIQSDVR